MAKPPTCMSPPSCVPADPAIRRICFLDFEAAGCLHACMCPLEAQETSPPGNSAMQPVQRRRAAMAGVGPSVAVSYRCSSVGRICMLSRARVWTPFAEISSAGEEPPLDATAPVSESMTRGAQPSVASSSFIPSRTASFIPSRTASFRKRALATDRNFGPVISDP